MKKGDGIGGRTVSTLKPVEKKVEKAPRAGAVRARPVPPSEFRRYYDRGDLPI